MNTIQSEIYFGKRGESFKNLIQSLLVKGKLKKKYINLLTDEESMQLYSQAFTSSSADPNRNYEIFEQLGDVSANKFIVWYSYRRFPQLACPLGVKVVARLRINYGAKQSFFKIANDLGFWDYISASVEQRSHRKKDLLEDSLESFCGVTEYILDMRTRPGVGYAIVYDILSSIFDEIDMSLQYSKLYDAKTRLKETFDKFPELGKIEYVQEKQELIVTSTVYRIIKVHTSSNKLAVIQKIKLGSGSASKKIDAQQKAASHSLDILKRTGFFKEAPEEYKYFCKEY